MWQTQSYQSRSIGLVDLLQHSWRASTRESLLKSLYPSVPFKTWAITDIWLDGTKWVPSGYHEWTSFDEDTWKSLQRTCSEYHRGLTAKSPGVHCAGVHRYPFLRRARFEYKLYYTMRQFASLFGLNTLPGVCRCLNCFLGFQHCFVIAKLQHSGKL